MFRRRRSSFRRRPMRLGGFRRFGRSRGRSRYRSRRSFRRRSTFPSPRGFRY